MKNLFCGIDISKDTLDYAICFDEDLKSLDNLDDLESIKIKNNKNDIVELISHLQNDYGDNSIWVCCEHTGNYGLLLASLLAENKVKFSMVSSFEIRLSLGLTRGKNDSIDAKRIAVYLAINNYKLKPTELPSEAIYRVKSLLSIRAQYVKIRTQLKNALKSLIIAGDVVPLKQEIKQYRTEIKRYDTLISKLEIKIKKIICDNTPLDENFKKITGILGVGLITAAQFIVCTNNFTAFNNARKFNCYSGLAPFEYSSGTSVKRLTKTSNYRNKQLKASLFKAANTAIVHDEQLKAYYKRKTNEGKHKMSVINAVACKLVYRVFAVVNRDEPFVRLAN